VQEVNAVSMAVEKLYPKCGSVIELGGQDAKIIIFKEDPETGRKKKIPSMNDKCAGGTGAVIDKINAKLQIPPEELALATRVQRTGPIEEVSTMRRSDAAIIAKIETVAMIANVFIFITFFIVNLIVIVLRIRHPHVERPFKIPGTIKNIPIISLLGMIMTFILFIINFYRLLGVGVAS
jgi:hypothetical protein